MPPLGLDLYLMCLGAIVVICSVAGIRTNKRINRENRRMLQAAAAKREIEAQQDKEDKEWTQAI